MDFPSKPVEWWLARVAIVVVAGFGLYGLGDALGWWVPVGIAAFVALAAWPTTWPRVDLFLLRMAGALLVAAVALVGFNVITGLFDLTLPILIGLAVALVLFALVAYWYLVGAEWGRQRTFWAAVGLALVAIVGAPIIVHFLQKPSSEEVPKSERVPSELDVLIVTDGSTHRLPAQIPPDPSLGNFDLNYSVGFAAGDRVRWTLIDGTGTAEALRAAAEGSRMPALGSTPVPRVGADSILLLLVDGTPPVSTDPEALPDEPARKGELERWRRVAASVSLDETPTFAVLQTTRPGRLFNWKRFATPGGAVSAQALGSLTATDAAVRLAVAAPTSRQDFTLAMEHRPVLLFDEEEPDPLPLSISRLFDEGRVSLCHDRTVTGTECETVFSPADLENGGTHLRINPPSSGELGAIARRETSLIEDSATPLVRQGAPGAAPEGTPPPGAALTGASGTPAGARSAIYVHPVPAERDGRELLYLDYWWYLADNPSKVGGNAFCGAGLVIPGITCQNHESDWEGVTVVVDRTEPEPVVKAVQYGQHDSVVRYGWNMLRKKWDHDPELAPFVGAVADASSRPLVFVAEGTHASYPVPCNRGRCHQVATDRGEGHADGGVGWVGNDSGTCGGSSCLQMLPTRGGGREPAFWNAFTGPWGKRHCVLIFYCNSGSPPPAPGRQDRYRHPSQYDGYVDAKWHFQKHAVEE